MDRNDLCSRAEQYKKEMLKMYGKRSTEEECGCGGAYEIPDKQDVYEDYRERENAPQKTVKNDSSDIAYDNDKLTEPVAENDKDDTPIIADNNDGEDFTHKELDGDTNADFSDYEDYPALVTDPMENLGESSGIIRVNVRTGLGTEPIEGASVIVTAASDGKRWLIAAGRTDISGTADIKAPAPDARYSQTPSPEKRPYSLYDVSVSAAGFFNARSVDIPVFSDITSVQSFNMIPAPLMTNPADETLTYFNQEPDL